MSTVELISSQQNCYEYKIPSILLSSTFLVFIVLFIDSSSFCSCTLSVRNEKRKNLFSLVCMPGLVNNIHSGTIMVKYFWEHDHQRV
jgi:hypothetical protein